MQHFRRCIRLVSRINNGHLALSDGASVASQYAAGRFLQRSLDTSWVNYTAASSATKQQNFLKLERV